MRQILAATLVLTLSSGANAGFFDSIFGSEKTAESKAMESSEKADVKATEDATAAKSTLETATQALALVPSLTSQLGVTEEQAQGGLGSLMQFAQSSLSQGEFSELSKGVPGMDTLLAAAPALSGNEGGSSISGMLSSLGGESAKVAGLEMLNNQFKSLGLNSDMIAKFADLAISYFSGQGGDTAALLQKGLGTLLGQ